MALTQTSKRYPVLTYFVLVFVLSWAFWIPTAITHDTTSFPLVVFAALGNIVPSLVGILLTVLFGGKSGLGEVVRRLGQLRVPRIWYVVVLVLPPVFRLLAIGTPTLLGLATIAVAVPVVGVLGSFVAGVGEELGWRGFALPRLQARHSAFAASLLLGVPWGLWHLPPSIAEGMDLLGFLNFVLFITGLSVLFTCVYNNTNNSLFLVILFHVMWDLSYRIVTFN